MPVFQRPSPTSQTAIAWHGDSWWRDSVPESLKAKVFERSSTGHSRREADTAEEREEFFQNVIIFDYRKILTCDANWKSFRPFLKAVGYEAVSKRSFDLFKGWNDIRNRAAHAERVDQVQSSDLGELDALRVKIVRWLIRIDDPVGLEDGES